MARMIANIWSTTICAVTASTRTSRPISSQDIRRIPTAFTGFPASW
jgi:hypothetical protein